jgi:hypothetical protein
VLGQCCCSDYVQNDFFRILDNTSYREAEGAHIPGTGVPGRLNFSTVAPRLLENLSYPAFYTNHMNNELAYSKIINCTIKVRVTDLGNYPGKVKYMC